jgi:hypothetical protein
MTYEILNERGRTGLKNGLKNTAIFSLICVASCEHMERKIVEYERDALRELLVIKHTMPTRDTHSPDEFTWEVAPPPPDDLPELREDHPASSR